MSVIKHEIPEVRFRLIELEKKHQAGEITLTELLFECAHEMLSEECFETMMPESEPLAPEEIMEYRAMPDDRKMKVSPDFWKREDIKKFTEDCLRVRNKNRGNVQWLFDLRRLLPEEDTISQSKITSRLRLFGYA